MAQYGTDQTADYEIGRLEDRAASLQRAGLLADLRDALEDLDAAVSRLPGKLSQARARGYVFKSYLEDQIGAVQERWNSTRQNAQREISRRVRDLEDDLHRAEEAVRGLRRYRGRSLSVAQSALNRVDSRLSSAERRVEAANDSVKGMFDAVESDVEQITAEVDGCVELLDLMDGASFGFQPREAGVAAVKARWLKDRRKEGPRGILFLTDRRLIFEQREKVAKKKVLFIKVSSELVQEMLWEAPIGTLVEFKASEKRRALVLKRELLTLVCKQPATVKEALLELSADSDAWRALINRVVTGDMNKERVDREEAAVKEPVIEVPSKCPTCGAGLDIQVVRGMMAVECPYCGTNIPLMKG